MILFPVQVEFFGVPFQLFGDEALDGHRLATFQRSAEHNGPIGSPSDHLTPIELDVSHFDGHSRVPIVDLLRNNNSTPLLPLQLLKLNASLNRCDWAIARGLDVSNNRPRYLISSRHRRINRRPTKGRTLNDKKLVLGIMTFPPFVALGKVAVNQGGGPSMQTFY